MTDSMVEIRTTGSAAADLLAALHIASFAESAAEPWSPASVAAILRAPGALALIAVDPAGPGGNDDPCGLAVARCGPDDAEILALGVLPERRRHGLGGRLLAALLELLATTTTRKVLLEVAVDNHPARRLYAAHGFAEIGVRRGYYRRRPGPPVDALILARSVDPPTGFVRGSSSFVAG